MADPASASLAIVALLQPGLQALRALLSSVDAIANVPSTISRIKEDVVALERAMGSLTAILNRADTPVSVQKSLEELAISSTISGCATACAEFQHTLQKWMKHSDEKSVFWWDRARIGLFGEAKLQSFQRQLNSSKATINLLLMTVSFSTSIQLKASYEQRLLRERRALVTQQQATALSIERTVTTDYQLEETVAEPEPVAMVRHLRDAGVGAATAPATTATTEIRLELQAWVQRELLLLRNLRRAQESFASQLDAKLARSRISNVRVSTDSRASVGFINTEGSDSLDIQDVVVEGRSRAVVGRARGVDMSNFWD